MVYEDLSIDYQDMACKLGCGLFLSPQLHDWEKDKNNKKSTVEALNRYEKHGLAGKRKIKPFSLLENGTEKILQQSAVERD